MPNIGIITTPSDDTSFAEPVYRFASILKPTAVTLYLFAGGVVERDSPLSSRQTIDLGEGVYLGIAPLDYLLFQVVLCYRLIQYRTKLNLLYFHKGAMGLVLPVLIARLLGIKTCTIKVGAFYGERMTDDSFTARLLALAQYVSFRAAHAVVVFSESEVASVPNDNVFVGFSNYRDFEKFTIRTEFEKRAVDIGFVGRFSEVKGITRMAEAAVALVESGSELKVHLVGDGPQYEQVERLVADYDQITLTGWVNHEEIVAEYNRIRVLIVPSTAEGLPTGVIEAMGCGVVVVATPVGSIKDLINHGETGFHLPNQCSEEIKRTYEQLRNRDDLATIGKQAREHVVANYSKETARDRFESITNSLTEEHSE